MDLDNDNNMLKLSISWATPSAVFSVTFAVSCLPESVVTVLAELSVIVLGELEATDLAVSLVVVTTEVLEALVAVSSEATDLAVSSEATELVVSLVESAVLPTQNVPPDFYV